MAYHIPVAKQTTIYSLEAYSRRGHQAFQVITKKNVEEAVEDLIARIGVYALEETDVIEAGGVVQVSGQAASSYHYEGTLIVEPVRGERRGNLLYFYINESIFAEPIGKRTFQEIVETFRQ